MLLRPGWGVPAASTRITRARRLDSRGWRPPAARPFGEHARRLHRVAGAGASQIWSALPLAVIDGERDGAAVAGGGLDDLDLSACGPVAAGAAGDRSDLDGRRAVEELHGDLSRRQHEGSLAGRLGLGGIGHSAREAVVSDLLAAAVQQAVVFDDLVAFADAVFAQIEQEEVAELD